MNAVSEVYCKNFDETRGTAAVRHDAKVPSLLEYVTPATVPRFLDTRSLVCDGT